MCISGIMYLDEDDFLKEQEMVVSDRDTIDMVDPSGGPYLSEGMKMLGKTIKEFKSNDKGYLIITE
jgi:hypothetical protein